MDILKSGIAMSAKIGSISVMLGNGSLTKRDIFSHLGRFGVVRHITVRCIET